jgi:hypothetical protein
MAPKNQRFWLTTDSQDVVIAANPDELYALVSDLPRMGEWSPECRAVEWIDGATGPVEGARFVGHNRTGPRGFIKWSRRGTIRVADPGRELAFATEEGGHEGTVWRFRFEPVEGGTRVTESYEVTRIPVWARIVDVPTNRHKELVTGMRHTLERLKAAVEAGVTTPGAR